MADAVHSYGAPADCASSDAAAVNRWAGAHGAAMPLMTVKGASCVGARTGNVNGRPGVTYLYSEGSAAVELSALPGQAPGDWPASETRAMNGVMVGMVHHGNQGLIVVALDEGSLMTFISQMQ